MKKGLCEKPFFYAFYEICNYIIKVVGSLYDSFLLKS